MKTVRVAIEGCCHGQLNKIYKSVPKNVELLIICGDFQAIRNQKDLKSMNVPSKYLEMGDFGDYYSGKKRAPVLTVFIGGNHESSSYLRELQYGGWVAPGIYYLGEYGTIWYKGLRISGLSGIWSQQSFFDAKSENPPKYTLPYGNSAIRSIYHIKPKNFLKLLLSGSSTVMLSHDWPKGIWEWGNKEKLLQKKSFLKADMDSGRLGSPLAAEALQYLRPSKWFSSHMHTLFEATVKHEKRDEKKNEAKGKESEVDINEAKRRKVEQTQEDKNEICLDMDDMADKNEISLEMDEMDDKNEIALDMNDMGDEHLGNGQQHPQARESESEAESSSESSSENGKEKKEKKEKNSHTFIPSPESSITHFMALDKCLPRRSFLSVQSIKCNPTHPSFKSKSLYYDARAIAVQKVVENFVRTPNWDAVRAQDMLEPAKMEHLLEELNERVAFEAAKISGNLKIPTNFRKVAPDVKVQVVPLQYWPNNQTKDYCEKWSVPEPDLEGL